LKDELARFGFAPSKVDASLYIRKEKTGCTYILAHVDDMLVAGSRSTVQEVKDKLRKVFEIRDLGPASFFLGMEITRNRIKGTLKLTQSKAVAEIVNRFGQVNAKNRSTPLNAGILLSPLTDDEPEHESTTYRSLVGGLLYIANCTRPDISFAVGMLCRYMSKPGKEHLSAAKSVLKYLAGSLSLGLLYKRNQFNLIGYCDSDLAGELPGRKSTSGYAFLLGGACIAWSSRLQSVVAQSTAEAEYMAAAMATKEALWLKALMGEFGLHVSTVNLLCDNEAAIAIANNPIISQRAKHIDMQYHFIRDRIARKEIMLTHVASKANASDVLTKPLSFDLLTSCISGLGMS
jgi:phosphopantetheinyl transferase (holo-ACP synthase)